MPLLICGRGSAVTSLSAGNDTTASPRPLQNGSNLVDGTFGDAGNATSASIAHSGGVNKVSEQNIINVFDPSLTNFRSGRLDGYQVIARNLRLTTLPSSGSNHVFLRVGPIQSNGSYVHSVSLLTNSGTGADFNAADALNGTPATSGTAMVIPNSTSDAMSAEAGMGFDAFCLIATTGGVVLAFDALDSFIWWTPGVIGADSASIVPSSTNSQASITTRADIPSGCTKFGWVNHDGTTTTPYDFAVVGGSASKAGDFTGADDGSGGTISSGPGVQNIVTDYATLEVNQDGSGNERDDIQLPPGARPRELRFVPRFSFVNGGSVDFANNYIVVDRFYATDYSGAVLADSSNKDLWGQSSFPWPQTSNRDRVCALDVTGKDASLFAKKIKCYVSFRIFNAQNTDVTSGFSAYVQLDGFATVSVGYDFGGDVANIPFSAAIPASSSRGTPAIPTTSTNPRPKLTFSASAGTITRSSGSWVTDLEAQNTAELVGRSVFVAGAKNSGNNGRFVISSATTTVLTIVNGTTLITDETGTSGCVAIANPYAWYRNATTGEQACGIDLRLTAGIDNTPTNISWYAVIVSKTGNVYTTPVSTQAWPSGATKASFNQASPIRLAPGDAVAVYISHDFAGTVTLTGTMNLYPWNTAVNLSVSGAVDLTSGALASIETMIGDASTTVASDVSAALAGTGVALTSDARAAVAADNLAAFAADGMGKMLAATGKIAVNKDNGDNTGTITVKNGDGSTYCTRDWTYNPTTKEFTLDEPVFA